jgi:hypothetical protein
LLVVAQLTFSTYGNPVARDHSSLLARNQGDQIGRICALWAIVYFWQFLENCYEAQILNCFFRWKMLCKFQQKNFFAKFRAIFSQTILVTLDGIRPQGVNANNKSFKAILTFLGKFIESLCYKCSFVLNKFIHFGSKSSNH